LLAAALVPACGGGGGAAPPVAAAPLAREAGTVVVRFDATGDGHPDLLTVDTAAAPFAVVEALEGRADGGASDATAAWQGRALDPAVAEALAGHLAGPVGDGPAEIEVVDQGRTFTVTVFD
jgi:hypothetical protein